MAERTGSKRSTKRATTRRTSRKDEASPRTRRAPRAFKHLDGCPEVREIDGEEVTSLEEFPAINPKGRTVRVTRCVECGEATYDGASRSAPDEEESED